MTTQTSQPTAPTQRAGFGPRRLAMYATAHPKRVLAVWGLLALIGIGVWAYARFRPDPRLAKVKGLGEQLQRLVAAE